MLFYFIEECLTCIFYEVSDWPNLEFFLYVLITNKPCRLRNHMESTILMSFYFIKIDS